MKPRVRSIQWWLLARELPVLLLIFAGAVFWVGKALSETLYSIHLEVARRSAMATVYAVQASMLAERSHRVWDRIVEKIPRHEGTEIEILNAQGKVLFSTNPAERETTPRLTDRPCVVCHRGGSPRPSVDTALLRDPEDHRYQVLVASLQNTKDCQPCHAGKGSKLGMVMVRQTTDPIDRQIRAVQVGLALVGGIALVATMLTTRWLLARYLGRPIRQLVAGAKAIGAGDLGHTIELAEPAELAVLADRLNRSTARLAQLQRELVQSERLAAIGETIAGLAHTLKNMLNGIRAGQYVIERAMETGKAEKLRTGWRVLKKSVGQVEKLIFDMLYYARERVPEREPVDPNHIIREALEALEEMAAHQDVELRADLDETVDKEPLDRTAVYRALLDLITNAVDACTESESGDRVVVRSRATPEEIILTVEDNGIGMTEEVQKNLFTRFYSTKAARGTGLGLLVVKKITEEHGGRIEVESVPGKGSAFHIHLPRASSPSRRAEGTSSRA